MNKELTPLDYFIALGQTCLMQSRNYKNNEVVVLKNGEKHTTQELGGIIKTDLERLEVYDKCNYQTTIHKDVSQISKELEALEIIKNKRVDFGYLVISDDLKDFNEGLDRKWKLTQEEYDLLREALL